MTLPIPEEEAFLARQLQGHLLEAAVALSIATKYVDKPQSPIDDAVYAAVRAVHFALEKTGFKP